MKNRNILIVEDDLISAAYLKKLCTKENFNVVDIVTNAKDALKSMKEHKVALILMDIMIDGSISGCELAMQIRSFNQEVIIIFLTAYTSDEMINYALDVKSYSYLLKPYRDIEITSTIKMALAVPSSVRGQEGIIEAKNGFKFNIHSKKFYHYSKEIFLSKKLHHLIEYFMKNRGKCVSYTQICSILFDEKQNVNTLRSTIHRLKLKLPDLELHSVSKTGYVLY